MTCPRDGMVTYPVVHTPKTNDSREIVYEREPGSSLSICPCCGDGVEEREPGRISCNKCWRAHYGGNVNRPYRDVIGCRDWMYDIGVRLRAEGKMPKLTCKDCRANSCDCNARHTWGYWSESHGKSAWNEWPSRDEAIEARVNFEKYHDELARGPVQRRSDPNPFEKKAERWGVWVVGPHYPDGKWVGDGVNPHIYDSRAEADNWRRQSALYHRDHTFEVRRYATYPAPTATQPQTCSAPCPVPPKLPPLWIAARDDVLARAIFETDPRLPALLDQCGDWKLKEVDGWIYDEKKRVEVVERWWRAEVPLAKEAKERVKAMCELLGKAPAESLASSSHFAKSKEQSTDSPEAESEGRAKVVGLGNIKEDKK